MMEMIRKRKEKTLRRSLKQELNLMNKYHQVSFWMLIKIPLDTVNLNRESQQLMEVINFFNLLRENLSPCSAQSSLLGMILIKLGILLVKLTSWIKKWQTKPSKRLKGTGKFQVLDPFKTLQLDKLITIYIKQLSLALPVLEPASPTWKSNVSVAPISNQVSSALCTMFHTILVDVRATALVWDTEFLERLISQEIEILRYWMRSIYFENQLILNFNFIF